MGEGRGRATAPQDEAIDTVVIGAGQAGLSVSYHLTRAGHRHVVLERDRIGASWASRRWDSFTLVTPNWMNRLPGFPYRGPDPDGFLARDEVVAYLEDYAASFGAPVRLGVRATRLSRRPDAPGYRVETSRGALAARNVVVTTGFFHTPKVPTFAGRIAPGILQVPSSAYRNPGALPPGAVLVVGSAQSGCQIAEELHEAGREVYLCVSRAPREPRRYRGRDINHWIECMGGFDRTFADPADPVERYRANPHCSGKNGGHAINLRALAARGITLMGRVTDADGDRLRFAPDLAANVAAADRASRELMRAVDDHIAAAGLDAPAPDAANTDDGDGAGAPDPAEIAELDLAARGVSTIVWATGFACDFSWIDLPILDRRGYPVQDRGVTPHPGLYFCGLHWMHCLKSGLLFGVGDGARHVARHLLGRGRRAGPAAA